PVGLGLDFVPRLGLPTVGLLETHARVALDHLRLRSLEHLRAQVSESRRQVFLRSEEKRGPDESDHIHPQGWYVGAPPLFFSGADEPPGLGSVRNFMRIPLASLALAFLAHSTLSPDSSGENRRT